MKPKSFVRWGIFFVLLIMSVVLMTVVISCQIDNSNPMSSGESSIPDNSGITRTPASWPSLYQLQLEPLAPLSDQGQTMGFGPRQYPAFTPTPEEVSAIHNTMLGEGHKKYNEPKMVLANLDSLFGELRARYFPNAPVVWAPRMINQLRSQLDTLCTLNSLASSERASRLYLLQQQLWPDMANRGLIRPTFEQSLVQICDYLWDQCSDGALEPEQIETIRGQIRNLCEQALPRATETVLAGVLAGSFEYHLPEAGNNVPPGQGDPTYNFTYGLLGDCWGAGIACSLTNCNPWYSLAGGITGSLLTLPL